MNTSYISTAPHFSALLPWKKGLKFLPFYDHFDHCDKNNVSGSNSSNQKELKQNKISEMDGVYHHFNLKRATSKIRTNLLIRRVKSFLPRGRAPKSTLINFIF